MLDLSAFNLRALGDTLTIIKFAKRSGLVSINQLERLVGEERAKGVPKDTRTLAERRTAADIEKRLQRVEPRCTVCTQYCKVLAVNTRAGNRIEGDFKSCGVCYNRECMNVDYYAESVHEVLAKLKATIK